MLSRSFLVRLSSITIALSMLLQSSFMSFSPRVAEAQRLKKNEAPRLQSAYTITGGKRTLRIVFDQPVRFTGEDPADFIFVTDEYSDEQVALSTLPNSFAAVSPESYGGHEFATAFDLFFENDLPQVGILNISSPDTNNRGKVKSISVIKDMSGTALAADAGTTAAAEYEIPLLLLGSTVVAPDQAVLFFNFDEVMKHQGRHPYAYHDWMLEQIQSVDRIAQGNQDTFLQMFEDVKNTVIDNPDMLRKMFWI